MSPTGDLPPQPGTPDPEADDRVWREMLGAYALGHLTDDELQQTEVRLAVSPRLRADLEEIRPIAAALPRGAQPDTATLLAPPPPDLEERILARIAVEPRVERAPATGGARPGPRSASGSGSGDELARARARRQLKRTGLAATAVAAAAAVVFAVAVVRDDDTPAGQVRQTRTIQLASASSAVPEASGTGTLIGFGWGTQIHMTIDGLQPGVRYRVYLEGPDGTRIDAGTFQALDGRPVVCEMSGDLLLDETATVVITEAGTDAEQPGPAVVTADVASAPQGTVRT
jgi:hypothetical protein